MRYVLFIHRDEDSGYGISFPDLPGCVSVGDTVDDAIRNGCEALAFHVEGLCDDGDAVPSPRSIEAIKADPELAEWRRGADIVEGRFREFDGREALSDHLAGLTEGTLGGQPLQVDGGRGEFPPMADTRCRRRPPVP